MPDVKEVVNGLEMSYKYSNVNDDNTLVPQQLVLDTLAILKAQEPVKPKLIGIYYVCGQCGMRTVGQRKVQTNDILKISNYCPDCGRPVKWDG
jgi:hypothetical protein